MTLIWRVLDERPVVSLSEYLDIGGGAALGTARQAPATEIIDMLSSSGLRGRGGAGFPTGTKWKTVAASRGGTDSTTVVVNAAEGEPGTFKDRTLLRTNPYRVLEGALIAAVAMQTDQIRIGIKATFGREIERLTAALAEMREAGWLDDLNIELVLGPSSYLFGEETALLEVVEGRQPFPRVTPPYRRGLQAGDTRSAVGVSLAAIDTSGGTPALVDNVETLANVPLIVDRGADWFREVGTERSTGTIVCTVSGATRRSGVGEVAMGTTLREAIDLIGWGPRRGHEVRVVLAGTANPLIPAQLLDTPLTYEALSEAGSGLGSAGFIVFDDTTEPAAIAAGVARFLAVESCGQCEPCKTDGILIADQLNSSLQTSLTTAELNGLRHRISTVTIGARCNLAEQQASVAASLLDLFPQAMPGHSPCSPPATEPAVIAPIADIVGGRAVLDSRQLAKQPDWSYGPTTSGASPAARLGNTPVHISAPVRARRWPEWSTSLSTEHPLELVDDAHAAIDALVDLATAETEDVERRVADVVIAIRTHIDVIQRVLYPMLRRVGGDEGDRLTDAAEMQERVLSRLADGIDLSDPRGALEEIGVQMRVHAHLDDEILELLRGLLDPLERSGLADGLAAARATSTVSRLRHTAATVPRSGPLPASLRASPPRRNNDTAATPGRLPTVKGQPVPTAAAVAPSEALRIESGIVQHEEPPQQLAATAAPVRPEERAQPTPRHKVVTVNRLLVGVDGSAAAAAALGWAGRLAERIDAEIVVGNVFEPAQAEVSPADFDTQIAEADHRLTTQWSAPLDGSGARHRGLQLVGSPDILLDAGEEVDADLLVVGTRGAGHFAGLHLGSLAHYLAHRARGPLAIIPVAGAAAPVDRIVVGVDGSPGSTAAVNWCAAIAAACRAEVVAIHVPESLSRWSTKREAERVRADADAALNGAWTAPLRAAGVSVRTRVMDSTRPVTALAEAADHAAAGLIVVGAREFSEVVQLRRGRIPEQLVHHTQVPVVLVPPPEPA
ncbi:MAG: universal stress protein [Microthrixaceae bacterium]